MAQSLNKKILCFVDECGTAGDGQCYFGAVLVSSRNTGRIDKQFSDLLEPNANEIHGASLKDDYCQTLLASFWKNVPSKNSLVLLNRKPTTNQDGSPPIVYAQGLIETVKVGLKRYRAQILKRSTIGNVELITDINSQNIHPDFDSVIDKAQSYDGLFRAVRHVAKIDSAASRMLQIADLVAYSRRWILTERMNAAALRQRFGIEIV